MGKALEPESPEKKLSGSLSVYGSFSGSRRLSLSLSLSLSLARSLASYLLKNLQKEKAFPRKKEKYTVLNELQSL